MGSFANAFYNWFLLFSKKAKTSTNNSTLKTTFIFMSHTTNKQKAPSKKH
jgi:hypothetical protein